MNEHSDHSETESKTVTDTVWLPIAEAARQIGLSRDGVLKRIRRGRLVGRLEDGRWLVQMPAEHGAQVQPESTGEVNDERTRELREEVAFLRSQIEAQKHQLEQDAIERSELRRLLGNSQQQLGVAQQQIQTLLPAPAEPSETVNRAPVQPTSSWWSTIRDGKQSLGASLTITGLVALSAGIILHFALKANVVETTVHLGYIIGLVGLLSLLIGLVLVF